MTSIYKISEKIIRILGKGEFQEISSAVRDSIATAVRNYFFSNKSQEGVSEIEGSFIIPFNNIVPDIDEYNDMYYVTIPSRYANLPYSMGIVSVSYQKSQNKGFVRIDVGALPLYMGLQAFAMGGNQIYYVEGPKAYFPVMDKSNAAKGISMKLAGAFDQIDDGTDINISPDVEEMIVQMVVKKQSPEPKTQKLYEE